MCAIAIWLKVSNFLTLQSSLDTFRRYEASTLDCSTPERRAFTRNWPLVRWWRNCPLFLECASSIAAGYILNQSNPRDVWRSERRVDGESVILECDVQINVKVPTYRGYRLFCLQCSWWRTDYTEDTIIYTVSLQRRLTPCSWFLSERLHI
jgi:hypothetical protein